MAEIKYLSLERLTYYHEGLKTLIANADSEILKQANEYCDNLADNYDPAGIAQTLYEQLKVEVDKNTAAIEKLNGAETEEGSVAKAVKDAKDALQANINTVDGKADKNAGDISALQGRMTTAEGDIDAVETDLGDVDGLSTTNKTVVGAINEVLAAVGTGGTASVVTITTDTTTDGALKSYTIKQGTTTVGVIDIPKDMVVVSGTVEKNPEGQPEGTYIKLVLANVAEPLYINVGTLVDIYTAKAGATQVQLAIDSSTREISATIVAGSITATELADNAVTTVKIADANVTKEKLSTSLQASIDKADAAAPQTALDEEETARTNADNALDARVKDLEAAVGESGSVAGDIATAKEEANEYTDAEIDKVEETIGAVAEGKTVVEMISDAQTAATYDDTEVRGLITANTEAIEAFVPITEAEVDALFA